MGSWTNPNVQQTIPLAAKGSIGGAAAATIVPGTPFNALNKVNISQFASYDLTAFMFAATPGAVNAILVGQIQLQWFDDLTSGIPIFEEDWWIWAGRAAPVAGQNTLAATGPMHGTYMSVNVFVPITAASNGVLQYINIFGSPRTVPYSDWRQNGQLVNPQSNGITLQAGGGTSFDNLLASISNLTLTANQLIFIPFGLYSGPVYYRMQCTVAALHDPVIADMNAEVSGGLGAGTANNGILVNFPTDTVEHEGTYFSGRSPGAFMIQGNAAGTTNFSLQVIAQQAA